MRALSFFPVHEASLTSPETHDDPGITLRDWFATFAPQPDESVIAVHERSDAARNPHNDSHKPKRRSRAEIIAKLRYEYADAMLAARGEG